MKHYTREDIEEKLHPGTEADTQLGHDEEIREFVEDLMVHDGDLTISGHLDYSKGQTLIKGDLIVDGTLSGDETGILVITGKLSCRNLYMAGTLDVVEASVKEAAFGFYEAGITSIQRISGKLLLVGNHSFEAEASGFEHVFEFDNYDSLSTGDGETLKALLTDAGFKTVANMVGLSKDDDGEKCWNAAFLDDGILR